MKLSSGARRAVLALAIVALITIAVVWLPPMAVRRLTLYYLDQAGVQASIGDVDANLFTGTVEFRNAKGHTDEGDGFEIGHLVLSLEYAPLLSKRLSLSRLAVQDSTIDIRRTAANALRVAGITVSSSQPGSGGSLAWGMALAQLSLSGLRLHYRQPAHGEQPAIDREVTFNDSSARDVVSWQADNDVPIDANLSVGDGRIQLNGQITPFGKQIQGHFTLKTNDFALDLLAPVTQAGAMKTLTGPLDSDQQIELHYDPATALSITLDGQAGWQNSRLALSNGAKLSSKHADWKGKVELQLMRADGKAGRVDTDGRMQVDGLDIRQPDGLHLTQKRGDWQGKTTTTLAAHATRLNVHGTLKADAMAIDVADSSHFRAARMHWKGRADTDLADARTHVQSDGVLDASQLDFSVPGSLSFKTDQLNWQGKSDTAAPTKGATQVKIDGHIKTGALSFAIAQTSTLDAHDMNWSGDIQLDIGDQLARQADGQLALRGARLALPDQPIALSAARLAFDGQYGETPAAGRKDMPLYVKGALDGHEFKINNTDIDAAWLAMLQAHVGDLNIDGLDSIAFSDLTAHGVRLLGDTNTSAAVLTSVTTSAKQFRLDDLTHYRLANLDISGANIHVRRNADGMGVMALYFGGGGADDGASDSKPADATPSTYAVDHLALSGPAVAFTDVAVEPNVKLTGADLNLSMENLDTAHRDRDANYRLSLDVGAYGHLDSRGRIAPLAPGGIQMNLDAWLRSLAMDPLSGYMNAAMGRRIANGAADGTLHLEATKGQLDGSLDTTLSNFRLADTPHKQTTIALGISMDSALALVRGQDDVINFQTAILGDVTNPYFSVKNLVREAVLAGLRTAIMSDYSPLGLVNKAKNAMLNLGRSLVSKPVGFEPGKHYVRPEDRAYLGHIAQAMNEKPGIHLTVQGHAVPNDADAMSLFQGAQVDSDNRVSLKELARKRGQAVRDYLAARNVNPDRIELAEPVVDEGKDAAPQATFTLAGR